MLDVGIRKTAFDDDYREITMLIKIYFDGPDNLPLIITKDNYLIDCQLLEETNAESDNPLGTVSANELNVSLLNTGQIFSILNPDSPYANKISLGITIEAFIQPTHEVNNAWISMGTFYVSDWDCDLGNSIALITCSDKLLLLGQQDMPIMVVQETITLKALMQNFFCLMGMIEYLDFIIDPNIVTTLKYAWLPSGKVIQFLQTLSQAGLCIIFMDKYNRVQVKSITTSTNSVNTLTDQNQIIATKLPQSIIRTYNGVSISLNNPSLSESQIIMTSPNLSIAKGTVQLARIVNNKAPIYDISYIELIGDNQVVVTDFTYDSWGIDISITNNAETSQVITIIVHGRIILNSISSLVRYDNSNVNLSTTKTLRVENDFIQDNTFGIFMADELLKYIKAYDAYIELEIRGNPLMELGDTITIDSPTDRLHIDVKPIRYQYNFDGTLSGQIKAINTNIL